MSTKQIEKKATNIYTALDQDFHEQSIQGDTQCDYLYMYKYDFNLSFLWNIYNHNL